MVKIIEAPEPRKLSADELRRVGVPYTSVERELVPSSAREDITKYLDNRQEMMAKGWGMIFAGPKGAGKTAAACGVLMHLRAYNYTCTFIPFLQLREAAKGYDRFDDDTTVLQRCMKVDVLCIDDLNSDSLNDKFFGRSQLKSLLSVRRNWRRPTIATTPEKISDADSPFHWLLDEMRDVWVPVYFKPERVPGQELFSYFGKEI